MGLHYTGFTLYWVYTIQGLHCTGFTLYWVYTVMGSPCTVDEVAYNMTDCLHFAGDKTLFCVF